MDGSKNRDYLANERTFLAYVRTALAFIAFGFVIARFSLYAREFSMIAHVNVPTNHTSAALGTGMAVAGIIVALYGSLRYAAADRAIRENRESPMPAWAAISTGAVVGAIGIVVAAALFAIR